MTLPNENILANLIASRAHALPDFDVLTIEGATTRPDEVRTYRQLWDNGRRMAQVLLDQGVRPGERFALLMANHAEFVEAMVAASVVGAAVVPIDPRASGEQLRFMLENAQCSGAFAADYALDRLQAVGASLPLMRWVMSFATDEGNRPLCDYPGVIDWLAAAPHRPPELAVLTVDPDSPLELIFTSGTTGNPKGIVMTHRRYCETSLLAPRLFGYRQDDKLYSGLSLTHANAQVITLGAALACRLRCVLSRRFTKSRLWDVVRRHACTSFTLLGGMTTAVYAELPKDSDAHHPVRLVISAGMPAAIWQDFERRFGVQILEFYGAAEGGLTLNPIGAGPVGSIGKTAPHLRHRIVDENGRDCSRGSPGEILFRHADGSALRVEYFGNPEASARKCADGWLHMGDVVVEDEDGWLFFQHRMDSGIRRNGEFINTALIEKSIAEHAGVDDVYVYGIPAANGVPGEKDVVAAVVPREPGDFDPQALFQVCRRALGAHYVPSRIQVLAQIPKTASEKPQDRFLIEQLQGNPAGVHQEAAGA